MNIDTQSSLTTSRDLLISERDRLDQAIRAIEAVLGGQSLPAMPAVEHACTEAEITHEPFTRVQVPTAPPAPDPMPTSHAVTQRVDGVRSKVLQFVRAHGQTRSRDLVEAGICDDTKRAGKALWDAAAAGQLRKMGDGFYGLADSDVSDPEAVIGLRSAPGDEKSRLQAVLDFVCDNGQTRAADVAAAGLGVDARQAAITLSLLCGRGLIRRVATGLYTPPAEA